MKIVILGAQGYIGKGLCEVLALQGHDIVKVTRANLDFDSSESYERLADLLLKERPRVVINAIGSIDQKVDGDPRRLFSSILLPTFSLFEFYSKKRKTDLTDVYILGSTSAGEPRTSYPLYAALKYAEMGLSRTAQETFYNSGVSWKWITVPRLMGGLGVKNGEDAATLVTHDKGLEELADTIRQEISLLSA